MTQTNRQTFLQSNKLHKIFNRDILKVSYSSTEIMS